ncbi:MULTISPECIES: hypothetical protein [Staphylococcus]|uniref:hypothetical protein n=1 Tax=Staphylococcus TaxID=1279 RepID=UPI00050E763A|nr:MULTISPECIES: hypothetical protein [Staphylococcus]KGF26186.1 hypothetical protein HMPREF2135_08570 [Staphylococcus haemolyticus DNF00585]OFL86575.1 hypothetical protein HMPREF2737_08450 [Staphylococcus sp. HMSC069D12]
MAKCKSQKKCPKCKSNNVQIIADLSSYFLNRIIFILIIFLYLFNIQYLENHIFNTLLLIIIWVSYVYIFSHSTIYIHCKNCEENFNFKFFYKIKDKDPDSNNSFSIITRAALFQMIFCAVISLIIFIIINFDIPLKENTKSIVYLIATVVISTTYIIISTIDMEDWISRSTKLKKEDIDFNKVYDTLAKLSGLLTTFYTFMYTKLSGNNYFELNQFLYMNVILFTLSFSNFVLEYITHKSNL